MKRRFLALPLLVLLSGCSWELPGFLSFGSSADGGLSAEEAAALNPTSLLPDFTDARLEPIEEGMVLRVTGIAPEQGYYSAVLVQVEGTDSTLRFQVRALAPVVVLERYKGRPQEMLVARVLTFSELQGVRTIEVISANRKVQLRNR